MKISSGQIVLLTGASGGLGNYMAHAFADRGANLMLVAYPGAGLDDLRKQVEKKGVRAIAMPGDVRDPEQRRSMVDKTIKEFGRIDFLVNNAGVELTSMYDALPVETLTDILRVNLEAPMILSHMVLPDMVKRGSGYIVNISSLAGKCAPAFQEPYAASKAGLIAFTTSLRATYRGSGVGATVVCPGFVETGIYAKLKQSTGCVAPPLLGTSQPETVIRAMMRAIEKDRPEAIISKYPFRPLLAFIAMFPSAGEWVIRQTGAHTFFKSVADAQARTTKTAARSEVVSN